MKFDKVQIEHIQLALEDYQTKGIPEGFGTSNYFDIEIDGELFPTKPIMAYANFHATGETLGNNFSAGRRTPCFKAYERLGIKIIPKSSIGKVPEYIGLYKKLISNKLPNANYSELYKWETFQHFKDNWHDDYDENSILQNLTNSFNYENNNLWSGRNYLPFKSLKGFAVNNPQKVCDMFRTLFDESKDLHERLLFFENSAQAILESAYPNENWVHYQSRRAMMLYLSLKYPGKYFLYKNGMFNDFCKVSNFWPPYGTAKKQDYTVLDEFLKMCNELKQVLIQDAELLQLHKKRLPGTITFEDDNNLLVQDFVYAVATYLNPDKLRNSTMITKEIEIEFPSTFKNAGHGQFQKNFRRDLEIPDNVRKVNVAYNSAVYEDLTLGVQGSGRGRIYFNNQKDDFINNNPELEGGEKIIIEVSYDPRENQTQEMENEEIALNQIFFGPPGTGKTYRTINEAIKIADPEFYKANHDNRDALKERFQLLLIKNSKDAKGQIVFTTFHQSFSYEDFVEGIKPNLDDQETADIFYRIEDGIFKRICGFAEISANSGTTSQSSIISMTRDEFDTTQFYKISLGNTQIADDEEIFDYCITNNCIAVGFGNNLDFSGMDERELKEFGELSGLERFHIQALNYFKNYLKIGDYVLVSNGNFSIRAIGKVTGDYEFVEESPFPVNPTFNHFRSVQWIYTGNNIPAHEIYRKQLSQQTIYKFTKEDIEPNFFVDEKVADVHNLPKDPKNYVLIIDEINRGNVSSIFGELITLIENDKRAGQEEELSAILPYSKKEFKVPQNVYIIGTMNTADKSIEALDTALRRRFSFREMPPQSRLIKEEGDLKEKDGMIDDIDVVKMLNTINDRIEKLIDKDHKIGHSYFMKINDESGLKRTFKNEVLPLLEEYFFGDCGKIGLVLGNSFIRKKNDNEIHFASFDNYEESIISDLNERPVYEISHPDTWNFISIYELKEDVQNN